MELADWDFEAIVRSGAALQKLCRQPRRGHRKGDLPWARVQASRWLEVKVLPVPPGPSMKNSLGCVKLAC